MGKGTAPYTLHTGEPTESTLKNPYQRPRRKRLILRARELRFLAFENHLIIEDFGQAAVLKNIGFRLAKELYSPDS